jgi:hypothetical protein
MSKMVRLDEGVYSALKARALREGNTLSEAVCALMHTASDHASTEKHLTSLELKIDQLRHQIGTERSAASAKQIKCQCSDSTLCFPAEILPKNDYQATKQSEAEPSSESTAESFIINTRLVSCAAALGSRCACASPGSVAAYHGALSRLRLGFKSRLGRSFFASV